MKLQTQTNLNYILFSAVIYIIVAGSFYLAVKHVIYEEVDRRLFVERNDFEHFIDRNGYWESSCYFVEDKITVLPVSTPASVAFQDTLMKSRYNTELVPFRQISFDKIIHNDLHRVSIRKSLIESDQLLKIITIVMLIVLSGGLSLLYLFQQTTAKRLWKPFYHTLEKAMSFDVNKGENITLPKQSIYEFDELNSSLNKMTDKILNDYQSLREFTENASHEIQTPLALINSRIEEIIQDKEISHRHISWIQDIHHSTLRLSKLNQALLLLTKIDNGQFQESSLINFNLLLEKNLAEIEDVILLKEIKIVINSSDPFLVEINPILADILLINLVNNAVKHNYTKGGEIKFNISENKFCITNTGTALTVDTHKMFERFQKQNKTSGSLGLGLAIVKRICDISQLNIDYEYENHIHKICLSIQQDAEDQNNTI